MPTGGFAYCIVEARFELIAHYISTVSLARTAIAATSTLAV